MPFPPNFPGHRRHVSFPQISQMFTDHMNLDQKWHQRLSHLNLQACHITDGETKDAADNHHVPEGHVIQFGEANDLRHLPEDYHEWNKEDAGVDVVVESQAPHIVVQQRQNFLGEDGIEGDAGAGHNPEKNSQQRQWPWDQCSNVKKFFILSK